MKLTLISPYPDITAFGVRTISSFLKERGHSCQLIFLPDPYGDEPFSGTERYGRKLDGLCELSEDSDLIGITLMTNFFDGAVEITRKLKSSLKTPVLWGGVHPTIRPEESLDHADMVCVGDGEDPVAELMDRMERGEPFSDVKNIWTRQNGGVAANPLRPLTRDLDIYPKPDFSGEDQHILYQGQIRPLTPEITREFLERGTVSLYLKKVGYQTMTGRGCPHMCTYCVNDTLKKMYHNENYLRWRSARHVIDELLDVKKRMPYVGFIWISDDAFFARKTESLEEFCREYKAKIALPFSCLASPMTVTEKKMEMLVDAGLIYIQMGIESGSARIQKLFNRPQMNNERIKRAAGIINRHRDKMFPPSYDFILDVPYETDQDRVESLKLISELPKPFQLQPFSLVLYPGTKLHQMAVDDGMLTDEKREVYEKSYIMREPNYLNLLMALAKGGRFPAGLLRLLVSAPVVAVLGSRAFKPFFKALYLVLKRAYRTLKKVMKRP